MVLVASGANLQGNDRTRANIALKPIARYVHEIARSIHEIKNIRTKNPALKARITSDKYLNFNTCRVFCKENANSMSGNSKVFTRRCSGGGGTAKPLHLPSGQSPSKQLIDAEELIVEEESPAIKAKPSSLYSGFGEEVGPGSPNKRCCTASPPSVSRTAKAACGSLLLQHPLHTEPTPQARTVFTMRVAVCLILAGLRPRAR